jgi:putative ABC transport system substrate-binding protein
MRNFSAQHRCGSVAVISAAILVYGLVAPTAWAQGQRTVTIGLLGLDARDCANEPLRTGLRELGYVEGKSLIIKCHHGAGRFEDLQRAADALAGEQPEVIVALTHLNADAAQRATHRIPIVFIASSDPVIGGFAKSFAHPAGNMTGLTYYSGELNAKRLQLLKTLAPRIRRVAILASPYMARSVNEVYLRDVTAAAKRLQLEIRVFQASGSNDLERAFDEMVQWKADAVYPLPTIIFAYEAQQIADLARWRQLPAIHWYKPFVTMGGLMSYGADYPTLQRRAALYVDKILKGAVPGDLPIEQPTRYELYINRETASEFGLTIPRTILVRADKVIE